MPAFSIELLVTTGSRSTAVMRKYKFPFPTNFVERLPTNLVLSRSLIYNYLIVEIAHGFTAC